MALAKYLLVNSSTTLIKANLSTVYCQSLRGVATICHGPTNKIFELRRYYIKPDGISTYIQCCQEHFHLRTSASKLTGFWMSEMGSKLNQSIHLWEFDNLEHRAEVRASLAKNEEWHKLFVSKCFPTIAQQENSCLYMPFWCNSVNETTKKNGVYELVKYNMTIGGPVVWGKQFRESVQARARLGCSDLIGTWYTEIGEQNAVYTIWRYDSFQKRAECKEAARSDAVLTNKVRDDLKNVVSHSTLLMLPTSWSPMQ